MNLIMADKLFYFGQILVIGVLVLGVLVLVHELGHFLVAKACGIRVLTFSIGFGKALLQKRIGDTDYKICAIPFGGYVHMAGEHPEDEHATSAPDEFPNKPIWQRALVAVAGPAANLCFAVLLLWVMFLTGVGREVYLERPVIGAVTDSSVAASAGLQAGDSIVSMNSIRVQSWEAIQKQFIRQEGIYTIAFVRNGQTQQVTITIPRLHKNDFSENRTAGLLPAMPARVGKVGDGTAAQQSGIQPDDQVIAVNGVPIYSWFQFSAIIAAWDTTAGPATIGMRRADTIVTITALPVWSPKEKRCLLGLMAATAPTHTIKYGPIAAIRPTFEKTAEYTFMIFDVLAKLVSKKVSPDQLSGPIGIVQMSGFVAFSGLTEILDFMALIGINLAVINLFPLIITDGGLLLFLLLEAIRRKPLALKYQLMLNRVAISFFILLFLYVTFNDIGRFPLMFKLFGR
jgi:regulator of sigma E protease